MRCGSFLVMAGLLLYGCSGGGEAGAGTPVEAGPCVDRPKTGSGNCSPDLASCWSPTWKPPKANPTACTEAQVLDDKSKCYGADFDPSCTAFERDRANATCLQCLFTTADETTYGALILLPNGRARANVPGCLALVDGDTSTSSCAAHYQAYEECVDAACMENCASSDDFDSCAQAAAAGVCAGFLRVATCRVKPIYAICTKYLIFDEYFLAMARAFCLTASDSGTSPVDGGESGAPEPEASAAEGGDSAEQ